MLERVSARTTLIQINLADNSEQYDRQGFAPFGVVEVAKEMPFSMGFKTLSCSTAGMANRHPMGAGLHLVNCIERATNSSFGISHDCRTLQRQNTSQCTGTNASDRTLID